MGAEAYGCTLKQDRSDYAAACGGPRFPRSCSLVPGALASVTELRRDFLRITIAVVTTVIRQHVVATGVMVALVLSGCRADPQERALQGMWYYRDPHLANIPAESALEERWIFDRGSFRHVACCFIQVRESGSYVILDQENGTLTLELYNLSGDRQGQSISSRETRQIRVVIDLQSDTLKIGRSGPFIRLTPLESDRE